MPANILSNRNFNFKLSRSAKSKPPASNTAPSTAAAAVSQTSLKNFFKPNSSNQSSGGGGGYVQQDSISNHGNGISKNASAPGIFRDQTNLMTSTSNAMNNNSLKSSPSQGRKPVASVQPFTPK